MTEVELPLELAGGGHRVEVIVVRPDVDRAVLGDRRGAPRPIGHRELPPERAVGPERVEPAVVRRDVDRAVGADRRPTVDIAAR